jgi:hypothetical protein
MAEVFAEALSSPLAPVAHRRIVIGHITETMHVKWDWRGGDPSRPGGLTSESLPQQSRNAFKTVDLSRLFVR